MSLALAAAMFLSLVPPVATAAAEPVCVTSCDGLDPSRAQRETFPVPERRINGRRLVLHVSDPDGMAWASIDDGDTGDRVWLDRSWDGGQSWDGLLGLASIPATWTGTRTLMFNRADPVRHRRGLLRACGDAGGVACTDWLYPVVCAEHCDGRAPELAVEPVIPVPGSGIRGRTVALHTDRNGLAFAAITAGRAGDEVWLDRSWDEGRGWPDGSSLGRKAIPAGQTATRSTMINASDPSARLFGGAVRACGRAVEGQEGTCTAWARPPRGRVDAAADALLWWYDPAGAWWPHSWWNSAVSTHAMIDSGLHPGLADRVFETNKGTFPAGQRGSDPIEGNFISRSIDDSAWWGLAWLAAHRRTGERKYLDSALGIAQYVHGFWDTGTCGGGVWWDRERTYKNAVTTGLYLRLAAELHRGLPGDTLWLARARTGWDWFERSGMINPDGLVNDGLSNCRNNNQTVWSYNQGLAIGVPTLLWRITGESRYLAAATRLATAATTRPELTRDGLLTESCDQPGRTCDDNQRQFKGIFLRYFAEYTQAATTGRDYLTRQANAIWTRGRDPLNRLSQRWAGDAEERNWRSHASAFAALVAAGGVTSPGT
ncbi:MULTISPECIES: glycoside hydrolase family 76 protein [unclassified Crossiella]|uniref:glycoside hydrolase family 76 protein n=1 Tax=unclassified Crossiella TaxID=2620835 RepID=UPI001FFEC886|nr:MULTISPECIES: glycoside hydrolase family 76 protein [unclassified Crossiella]MCK2244624.1 glycoside hydrolase family 76 protein [Crossiella sp. S99.2]MCK2258389.1 glycoside hydrolase family 76 protein [Crossiella sp. S99.1]